MSDSVIGIIKPSNTIEFYNKKDRVGVISLESGSVDFEGNADLSYKVLLDYLNSSVITEVYELANCDFEGCQTIGVYRSKSQAEGDRDEMEKWLDGRPSSDVGDDEQLKYLETVPVGDACFFGGEFKVITHILK